MSSYGQNLGYIDDLYRRYQADPASVSAAWQEFFKDYVPGVTTPDAPARTDPAAAPPPTKTADAAVPDGARPMRGIAARIVENMQSSLTVPTATSVRTIPVKVLEENRRIINYHQSIAAHVRISFTHLIAWSLVRALEKHPAMTAQFIESDGTPYIHERESVNLGLAIDIERKGERLLLVPNIKDATKLGFPEFVAIYDDLVARTRDNKLTVDDFADTTLTLTNPGMLGTVLSVPRLMTGQSAIIGSGSIGFPAEFTGMPPATISELGLSKVMTITSTYDHRVIQGAESGRFLLTVESLLQGQDGFYKRLFEELGVPREPFGWIADRSPDVLGDSGESEAIAKQAGVLQLIRAYRVRGHLWADLDPLSYQPLPNNELELSTYGLSVWDLDRRFMPGLLGGRKGPVPLREILDTLQNTYCRHVGVEYMHIPEPETRRWIYERLERAENSEPLSRDEQIRILRDLNVAEAFETFLHTSYVGQKRFSLEGAETVIPMLNTLLREAAAAGAEDVVIGMAHRGRLNVLANVVGKSYGQVFSEFEGNDPESTLGSGDVKYHLGAEGRYEDVTGRTLRVTVASNPSHLEAVNPVVEGMVRARQDRIGDDERTRVLPVLIHGDAAFSGQGVVAETLNLSRLRGYRTGGTVHIVINNQIGFTTSPVDLKSSLYATDVAKMVQAPIFHVNGDQPEEAVRVIEHAFAYRAQFKRDVVVDLFCYRRWGHNEADDPSYTNPILYAKIKAHRSVRKLYTERLVRRGDFDMETAEEALEHFRQSLREVHDEVRKAAAEPAPLLGDREPLAPPPVRDKPPADLETLERVVGGLDRLPETFRIHPKLGKQFAARRKRFDGDKIDWGLAEALAFGTLTLGGTPVRLSGEDSGRGTFSQRHAVLYDTVSAEPYVPLDNLAPDQAQFGVFDSLLSEFGVLGFDYGYSVEYPERLVLWEAQFGDFCNGAQVIIDQFLTSAEDKWNQRSSLVMLLPHGYEGQGPEHSSARLERFLQLSACGNIHVGNFSTPAQYFHALRAQVFFESRKPLVLMTPKSLLRHPACVSTRAELTEGRFEAVLDDPRAPSKPRRLVFCCGKVFYDLDARREHDEVDDVAVYRIELLYPFPVARMKEILERHPDVTDIVWLQEEPQNMGAWSHVGERLTQLLHDGQELRYAGRPRAASTASGSHKRHLREQDGILSATLAAPVEAAE